MQRVLCGALLAVAAFASVPAHAAQGPGPVSVTYQADEHGVGVGTGLPGQPLVGAHYNRDTGKFCTGFSYQIPFCVVIPISWG